MSVVPFIWLGVLAFLLIVEALTAGLTTIWFAGGALTAAVAAYFGAGPAVQIILFLVVSLVLVIFTRPVALRIMNREVEGTNVNSLPGRRAVVTSDINNLAQTGQVRLNDVEWSARAVRDELIIRKGTSVRILEVKGVKLIVEEWDPAERRES